MSFLVAIGVGVVATSTAYGAYKGKQQEEAYGEAETAAGQIQQQKVGLLGEQKGIAGQTAQLGFDVAQSQFAGGQRDVSMGTQMGMRGIQAGAATAASRSGLATSGTIEQQTKIQTGDLMAKYKSDMTKLFETRDLSKAEADLSYRKGEMSAEESFQNTMAGFDEGGMGAGALEGFMSGIGQGASIAASDRRLKANIDYIGDSPSGIKIYEFNYLNNDVRHRGVIANELVDSYPNAISEDKDGYYMVDYSQIDVNFEIVKGD